MHTRSCLSLFAVPILSIIAVVSGCQSGAKTNGDIAAPAGSTASGTATAAAPSVEDAQAATEIFATRCTPCHGPLGAGDGPASATLTPRPAAFSTVEWQTKTTDEHIEKIIVYGGMAVGKSPAMPPNPDLDAKPNVVKALRAHLRSLKK